MWNLSFNIDSNVPKVLFIDNEIECGFAEFGLENNKLLLNKIFFNIVVGIEQREFYIRALLLKLSVYNMAISLRFDDTSFEKYGFEPCNGGYELNIENLKFPSNCKGEH